MLESENILLRRFAATGDAQAFSEIVQQHAGLVYAACLRVLADRDRAADAVQETFLQLLRNAATITGSVPTWLHRVATRKAIDVIRRDSSRKQREAKYAADRPFQITKWQDLSRYVDEGLDELDEQTRQILIQHFFQGRTTKDIAAGGDISQPTVSRRIESGVAQLRGKLRKRGIIVGAAALVGLLGENVVQAAPAVVLKELGKIALVGGQAAAAAGAGATVSASSAGAKAAATGLLAGVKAKIITAAAVTVVGVGLVVTYNHVTEPSAPKQPTTPVAARQSTPSSSRSPARPAGPAPIRRRAATTQEIDWSQWEGQMWEEIFAEDTSVARPARPVPGAPRSKESIIIYPGVPTPGMSRGFGGGFIAGPADGEAEPNTPPGGFGGYGGFGYGGGYDGYGGRRRVRPPTPEKPEERNSPDANSPENRR